MGHPNLQAEEVELELSVVEITGTLEELISLEYDGSLIAKAFVEAGVTRELRVTVVAITMTDVETISAVPKVELVWVDVSIIVLIVPPPTWSLRPCLISNSDGMIISRP